MPETQAWEKGIKLGWRIEKLEGAVYVAEDLDKKLDGGEDYELTFMAPVDIVLQEKGPQVITELTVNKFQGKTYWTVVNGKGVVVREDMEMNKNSPIVDTLEVGAVLTADELAGKRLHIVAPVKGWVSLKNKKGYVLVERQPENPGGEEIPSAEE